MPDKKYIIAWIFVIFSILFALSTIAVVSTLIKACYILLGPVSTIIAGISCVVYWKVMDPLGSADSKADDEVDSFHTKENYHKYY
jgi:hypothetical protein